MALQGELTTEDGITHQAAYARVIETNINWLDGYGRIVIGIWHGQATRDEQRRPVAIVGIDLDADGTPDELDANGAVVTPGRPGLTALLGTLKASFGPALYAFLKAYPTVSTVDFSTWEDV